VTGARAMIVALALAAGASTDAAAQAAPAAMPELRADLIVGHAPAIQLGAGVQLAMGTYVRIGLDGAAGVATGARTADASSRADGRVDLLARFLLDPFRQRAYGLSVGGGLSLRAEPGDRVRPLLLVALDVEGRRSARGVVPALQVGVGGGLRLGIVLRRAARLTR
jgi:hypothetical protein